MPKKDFENIFGIALPNADTNAWNQTDFRYMRCSLRKFSISTDQRALSRFMQTDSNEEKKTENVVDF